MQQSNKHKQFTVRNDKGRLTATLDSILTYLHEILENSNNRNGIFLRSKWIVTELFTNASKHSNNAVIRFDIKIENATLQITKSDHGEPFSVSINGERKYFPADFAEKHTYLLHKDDLSILYAAVNDGTLSFCVEDNTDIADIAIPEIYEHFGLIIITKSSDKFIYKYDSSTETNIFTASIVL